MEQKDINFSGYTTKPDDYLCPDGGEAFSSNAVIEDGGVRDVPRPECLNLVTNSGERVFLHSTAQYTHYLVVGEDDGGVYLYWVDKDLLDTYSKAKTQNGEDGTMHYADAEDLLGDGEGDGGKRIDGSTDGSIDGSFVSLALVGNTVVLSATEGMRYYLWKATEGAYVYLGDRIPEVDMRFGLNLSPKMMTFNNLVGSDDIVKREKVSILTDEVAYTTLVSLFYSVYCGGSRYYTVSSPPTMRTSLTYRLLLVRKAEYRYVKYVGLTIGGKEYTIKSKKLDDDAYTFTLKDIGCTVEGNLTKIHVEAKYNTKYSAQGTLYVQVVGAIVDTDLKYVLDNTSSNHTAVLGAVNTFVNSYGKQANRFIHPFFVRYATKLYDGSYTNISVPCYMSPNSGYAPWTTSTGLTYTKGSAMTLYGFVASLEYQITSLTERWSDWSDLIMGISIFCSQPIYPYTQDEFDSGKSSFTYHRYMHEGTKTIGERIEYGEKMSEELVEWCAMADDDPSLSYLDYAEEGLLIKYYITTTSTGDMIESTYGAGELDDDGEFKLQNLYTCVHDLYSWGNSNTTTWVNIDINAKDDKTLLQDTEDTTAFYEIADIDFDDVTTTGEMEELELEEGTLSGLEGRTVLSESEFLHYTLSDARLHQYNTRLHAYNGQYTLPTPTNPAWQTGFFTADEGKITYCAVLLHTSHGDHIVEVAVDAATDYMPWFYYPDTRAYAVVICYNGQYFKYQLTKHTMLNGAYVWLGWTSLLANDEENTGEDDGTGAMTAEEWAEIKAGCITHLPTESNIYVSEAGNPFVFPTVNTVTVGSGKVIGLASAAKALSQGQFGSFPLYAFTSEGVWALTVDTSSGVYAASQPISRDVCINANSITQLDGSVVFATDRGLMEIDGSQTRCLSENIDGDFGAFNPLDLPYFLELCCKYTEEDEETIKNRLNAFFGTEQAFFAFIRNEKCRIAYDYTHQRLEVFNPECEMSYVYSMQSGEWSVRFSLLQDTVNSYPDAYVLEKLNDEKNILVNQSKYSTEERKPLMYLTRPMKLENADLLKTLNTIVLRGYFHTSLEDDSIACLALWGSQDLFRWHFVAHNRGGHRMENIEGTPYKYYRLLIVANMSDREVIAGTSTAYTLKGTNQIR